MTVNVEIEGKGTLEFPDGTAPEVIDSVVKRDFFPKPEPSFWDKTKAVVNAPTMPGGGLPAAPEAPVADVPVPKGILPDTLAVDKPSALEIIQKMKSTPVAPGMSANVADVAPQGLNERGQDVLVKPILRAPVEAARSAALLTMPLADQEGKADLTAFIDKASAAIKNLSPKADPGFVDRFVSGAVGLVPYLATGGAGAVSMLMNSAARGIDALDNGIGPDTATALSLKDLATTAAMFKLPMAGKTYAAGVTKGAAGNVALDVASKGAEKGILTAAGYPEQAKKVEVLQPESLGEAALMGGVFGAHATEGAKAEDAARKKFINEEMFNYGMSPDVTARAEASARNDQVGAFLKTVPGWYKKEYLSNRADIDVKDIPLIKDHIDELAARGAGIAQEKVSTAPAVATVKPEPTPIVSESGALLPAIKDLDTQKIYTGKPGQIHMGVVEDNSLWHRNDQGRLEDGFATADGKFLTRDEATEYKNKAAAQPAEQSASSYPGPERRESRAPDKVWKDMTPEEQEYAAHHDYMTGLKNRRSFNTAKPDTVGLIDLDGFGKVNKDFDQTTGDNLLMAVADAIKKVGGHDWTFRLNEGGDELAVGGNTWSQVTDRIKLIDKALQRVIIKGQKPDGTVYTLESPRFSYGIDKDYAGASKRLLFNKDARVQSGDRIKGDYPRGMVVKPAEAGTRYGENEVPVRDEAGRAGSEVAPQHQDQSALPEAVRIDPANPPTTLTKRQEQYLSHAAGSVRGIQHDKHIITNDAGDAVRTSRSWSTRGDMAPWLDSAGYTHEEVADILDRASRGDLPKPHASAQWRMVNDALDHYDREASNAEFRQETGAEHAGVEGPRAENAPAAPAPISAHDRPQEMKQPKPEQPSADFFKATHPEDQLASVRPELPTELNLGIPIPTKAIGEGVRKLSDFLGEHTPPYIKDSIGMVAGLPNFQVETHPLRKPIYDLNLKRSENRVSDAHKVFTPEEGYAGAAGTMNLKGQDKADFDSIALRGDAKDPGYKPEDMTTTKNPAGRKVSQAVIDAYRTNREMLRREQDVIVDNTKNLALIPYEGTEKHAKLGRILDDLLALPTGKERDRYFEDAYRSNTGMQKDLARVRKYAELIHDYRGVFEAHPWYMPRVRKNGEFQVRAYDTSKMVDGKPTLVFMDTATTDAGVKTLLRNFEADPKAYLDVNFDPAGTYRASWSRSKQLPESMYQGLGNRDAIEQVISRATAKLETKGRISSQEATDLDNAIFETLAEEIAARGAGRAFIKRQDNLVEGYNKTDLAKSMVSQVNGIVGWLSKAEYAIRGTKAISEIPLDRPSDLRWAHSYFMDSLKNSDATDQMFAKVRGVASLYYLGGNVSSAIVNSFQHYMTAIPEMSRYTNSNFGILENARKDVLFGHLTDFDKRVLADAVDRGVDQAKNVREITGKAESGPIGSAYTKVVDVSMKAFQYVESDLNRKPAFLAAMRLFTGAKDAKGKYYGLDKKGKPYSMDYETAMKKAEEFVNATHYVIGKENLPEIVRKAGAIGRAAYTFAGYTHNYLSWLFNRATQGEIGVVSRALFTLWAIGGLKALPGAEDIDKWMQKKFGILALHHFRIALRERMKELGAGETAGDAIEQVIMGGLPSLAKVAISRKVGINTPFGGVDDKSAFERVAGVWGSILSKGLQAGELAAEGDYGRAAERALPMAAENALGAIRQKMQGATNIHGKPVTDDNGEQVQYTTGEMVRKGVGFMPSRIADIQYARSAEQNLKQYWNDKREKLLDRYRKSFDNPEENKKVVDDIMKFNDKLIGDNEANVLIGPITPQSLRNSVTVPHGKKARGEAQFMREMVK